LIIINIYTAIHTMTPEVHFINSRYNCSK